MSTLKKYGVVAAILAVMGMTATSAQARNDTWVAAGAGFAAGALVGAAAANANARYYDPAYAYYGPAYAYEPAPSGYVYSAPYGYGYAYEPGYATYAAVPGYVRSTRGLNGSVGIDVYANGDYIGSDPDPNVRGQMLHEERIDDR
ncbi:MAG TPA: hypothetical protein VFA53_01670 [Xanthobacteraceae bacterium]|nr:hypothetical protein [Xanthobacteraceae bacterium]